jgi:hypothetical protein
VNPQSEWEIDDALAHTMDERDCLLPDDDTAVALLNAALREVRWTTAYKMKPEAYAAKVVGVLRRLREGGQQA